MTDFDTTLTRAMSEAERASIEAASQAAARGDIKQREIAPNTGVWRLQPKHGERS